jgi:hypothetical protein
MTAVSCTCRGLPMGPGQTCNAHQLPAGKQVIHLVFAVEVEVSSTSADAVHGVIDDIDSQVSGRVQEIRIKTGDGDLPVIYQVNEMHGRLKES